MPRAFWSGLAWGLIPMDAVLTFTMTENPSVASQPDVRLQAILAGMLVSLMACLALAYSRFVPVGTGRGWLGGFLLSSIAAAPLLFFALLQVAKSVG
jgi:hypothetical protein